MSRLTIRNARLIDPASEHDGISDLHIDSGRVLAVGPAPAGYSPEQELDASGLILMPGLVDLGACLREPGQEHKATIASEAAAAAAGGITSLCASPATDPITDTTAVVELITRRARQARQSRVIPLAALTRGLQGEQLAEMAAMKGAGCVAVSDGGRPVINTLVLRRAMEYASTQDLPILLTPVDPFLSDGSHMHEGWVSTRLGLAGIPVAAETAALARYLALVEETGARVHFCRLSSARGADMVRRARQEGLPVSADVALHQLFLTEMDVSGYDSNCNVLPPLRGHADREALRHAVADGVIQAICSDHRPHDPDAKQVPFVTAEPGISGLDTLLALTLRLVEERLLDLPTAIHRVTAGPAGILGLTAGRLQPGDPADLCLLAVDEPWRLDQQTMRSHGRNSPFMGWEFTGRVRMTLLEGRIIHQAPETVAPA
ncbi:MAG: dihydroorotase [Ectothiorhodospiraceae bacterium]|nr:dihydroorotase [Ectothiorhodospiraceae bacterium]MCH8502752.1 dihydroorotase [Ectothiorhodospiraceae bacterium]